MLAKLWKSTSLTKRVNLRLYRSNVLSVLIHAVYGCQTWRLTAGEVKKLYSFLIRNLRRILRIPWFRKIMNAEIPAWRPLKQSVKRGDGIILGIA